MHKNMKGKHNVQLVSFAQHHGVARAACDVEHDTVGCCGGTTFKHNRLRRAEPVGVAEAQLTVVVATP